MDSIWKSSETDNSFSANRTNMSDTQESASTSKGLFDILSSNSSPANPFIHGTSSIVNIFRPCSEKESKPPHGLFGLALQPELAKQDELYKFPTPDQISNNSSTNVMLSDTRQYLTDYESAIFPPPATIGDRKSLFHFSTPPNHINSPSTEIVSTSLLGDHKTPYSSYALREDKSLQPMIAEKKSVSLFSQLGSSQSSSTAIFGNLDKKGLFGITTHQKKNINHSTSFHVPTGRTSVETEPSLSSMRFSSVAHDFFPTLKLTNLNEGLNKKFNLLKKFTPFGNIQRIICQPSVKTAMISFSSINEAKNAKLHANEVLPGVVTSIVKFSRRYSDASSDIAVPKPRLSVPEAKTMKNEESTDDQLPITPDVNLYTVPQSSTLSERLAYLEARDEAEHEKNSLRKQASSEDLCKGDRASRGLGTCLDMCPETERYMRELRHRVSVFEIFPNSSSGSASSLEMDHTRAVKDYSRSSADQAEPLPWELRPPDVLQRTMSYLLAAIADRPEQDTSRNLWKPWYEFLWTRTRAIRKDITQQRICSPTVVEIMEKIIRFHIFCAARLVDQPLDSFDPQINSENLTQCLQTLKEFYDDLVPANASLKNDSPCPHEPEFRSYMILMKLNECSVLDEVQKFSVSLRKSAPVRFAVEVHSALAERNYVRFFRLVLRADCLTSCLLHRYFGQVRSQALLAMSSAFIGHPGQSVFFPLTTLIRLLAFESESDAREFYEHWGLETSETDLIFKRKFPPKVPEIAWKERRAQLLVESKREGIPLSVLFNGGPLDLNDALPPPIHSSFDVDNIPERLTSLPDVQRYNHTSTSLAFQRSNESKCVDLITWSDSCSSTLSPISINGGFAERSTYSSSHQASFSGDSRKIIQDEVLSEIIDETIVKFSHSVINESLVFFVWNELIDTQINEIIETCLQQCNRDIAAESTFLFLIDHIILDTVNSIYYLNIYQDVLMTEIFNDLLHNVMFDMARRLFMKAQAVLFDIWRTLVTFFDIWRYNTKQRFGTHLTKEVLASMPACPDMGADSIYLAGSKVINYCNHLTTTEPSTVDSSFRSKRIRFSSWPDEVDSSLAWSPFHPISGSDMFSFGIIPHSNMSRGCNCAFPCCNILLRWLMCKLQDYPNFIISSNMTKQQLSNLSALICIGSSLSCFSQHTSPSLPTVFLYPSKLDDSIDVIRWPDCNFLNQTVVIPLKSTINFSTLAYSWSPRLQDCLFWLSKVVQPPVQTQNRKCIEKTFTLNARTRFIDIFSLHMEKIFLLPLLSLAEDRAALGLIDPNPNSILQAYNDCVAQLISTFVSFSSHQGRTLSFSATEYELLCLPSDQICEILNQPHDLFQPIESFLSGWAMVVESVLPPFISLSALDLSRVALEKRLEHISRRLPSFSNKALLNYPLIPWSILCSHLIKLKLETLLETLSQASSIFGERIDSSSAARVLEITTEFLISRVQSTVALPISSSTNWLSSYLSALDGQNISISSVVRLCEGAFIGDITFSDAMHSQSGAICQDSQSVLLSKIEKLEERMEKVSKEVHSIVSPSSPK